MKKIGLGLEYNEITAAIEFLQKSIGNETAFVGFSGGKDSIVTAELVRMSGVKYELYYSFTGIDAPEIVRFIRKYYPECRFLMPHQTFWRNLSVNIPPSNRLRWCCTTLKKKPSWRLPHKKRVMGIRAEESTARASRGQISYFEKLDHTHFKPIFYWKEWQIWDFINVYKLPYPVLYDWGFERIGCVICPFHSEKTGKKHEMYRKHWPKYFDLWEKCVTDLFTKRQRQGKIMNHNSAREFLDAWYLNDLIRWYK